MTRKELFDTIQKKVEKIERYNQGDGAEFTKRNKNFKLVYSEKFLTLLQARRREK